MSGALIQALMVDEVVDLAIRRMIWYNLNGDELPYTVLQPGDSKLYRCEGRALVAGCPTSEHMASVSPNNNSSQAVTIHNNVLAPLLTTGLS